MRLFLGGLFLCIAFVMMVPWMFCTGVGAFDTFRVVLSVGDSQIAPETLQYWISYTVLMFSLTWVGALFLESPKNNDGQKISVSC